MSDELLNLCAHELMDTVPLIIQALRIEMRLGRGTHISIPQFRTLRFIQRNPNSSLTDLSDFLGLTPPSASKLVDGLAKQQLVTRLETPTDRRRLSLKLTPPGEAVVNSARAKAQSSLSDTLSRLSDKELETVTQAMQLLRPLFVPTDNPPTGKE